MSFLLLGLNRPRKIDLPYNVILLIVVSTRVVHIVRLWVSDAVPMATIRSFRRLPSAILGLFRHSLSLGPLPFMIAPGWRFVFYKNCVL